MSDQKAASSPDALIDESRRLRLELLRVAGRLQRFGVLLQQEIANLREAQGDDTPEVGRHGQPSHRP